MASRPGSNLDEATLLHEQIPMPCALAVPINQVADTSRTAALPCAYAVPLAAPIMAAQPLPARGAPMVALQSGHMGSTIDAVVANRASYGRVTPRHAHPAAAQPVSAPAGHDGACAARLVLPLKEVSIRRPSERPPDLATAAMPCLEQPTERLPDFTADAVPLERPCERLPDLAAAALPCLYAEASGAW